MRTNTEYQTTRIWGQTLQALRFIHAITGESIVFIIDRLAKQELERLQSERKYMQTIQYIDLSEGAQKVIDSFPEEQSYTFFAHPRGKGYEVKPVEDSKLDLIEAQGGMGEGWMQVVFSQEQ